MKPSTIRPLLPAGIVHTPRVALALLSALITLTPVHAATRYWDGGSVNIAANGFGPFTLNSTGYLTASVVAGYTSWKSTNAPTGTSSDDFDGDGVANGIEYLLGGTASTKDHGKLSTLSISGGNMVFSFVRRFSSSHAAGYTITGCDPNISHHPP